MNSKPVLLALLAVACVAAAAGGGYFATRGAMPLAVSAPAPTPAVEPLAAPASSVSETEALVADVPGPPSDDATPAPAVEAPTARPAIPERQRPARSAEPPARPATEPRASTAARRDRPVARQPEPAPQTPAAPVIEEPQVARTEVPDEEPIVEASEPEREVSRRMVEELVVSANSVLGLQLETTVSSETAHLEDRVNARVTRDVMVGNDVAIPAGSRAIGSITTVERGGKVREKARLGVRFHTLVLADGTTLPIRTEALLREGDSPAGESASKIGGAAVGGAILGAILGGKRGAILGGTAGAAGGTAAVMAGGRNPAVLESGSPVTVRLTSPVTVTVEK